MQSQNRRVSQSLKKKIEKSSRMRRSHASVSPHNFSALSHISAITFWVVFKNSAGVYEARFFLRDWLTLLI